MKNVFLFLVILFSSFAFGKSWSGTGFALCNGYIVTNCHVIDGADSIVIHETNSSKLYVANVINFDKKNDLAVLHVSDNTFSGYGQIPYSLRTSMLDVGEKVWALGFPMTEIMGSEIKYTDGVISSRSGSNGDISFYQMTVPIQPGNSGGPLFDSNGKIVGITSAGLNREKFATENVNYSIKISYLLNLLESSSLAEVIPHGVDLEKMTITDAIKIAQKYVYYITCEGSAIQNAHNILVKKNDSKYPYLYCDFPGFEPVDLGLSVKWASCNLGVDKPYLYGELYYYGVTEPEWLINGSPYRGNNFKKLRSKLIDNNLPLELDPAYLELGDGWRMPTAKEMKELYTKCTWSYVNVEVNGRSYNCFLIVGPNDNFIILRTEPIAKSTSYFDSPSEVNYLSSSAQSESDCMYGIRTRAEQARFVWYLQYSDWGYIRPVYTK